MKNKLRYLRKESDLTLRALKDYTGISISTISFIENKNNGQRTGRDFTQHHLLLLSFFFNVSVDYLLGNSDIGIKVYFEKGDDEINISETQYNEFCKKDQIRSELLYIGIPNIMSIQYDDLEKRNDKCCRYVIHRTLIGSSNDYQLVGNKTYYINELIKDYSVEQLDKIIKFIKEFL